MFFFLLVFSLFCRLYVYMHVSRGHPNWFGILGVFFVFFCLGVQVYFCFGVFRICVSFFVFFSFFTFLVRFLCCLCFSFFCFVILSGVFCSVLFCLLLLSCRFLFLLNERTTACGDVDGACVYPQDAMASAADMEGVLVMLHEKLEEVSMVCTIGRGWLVA